LSKPEILTVSQLQDALYDPDLIWLYGLRMSEQFERKTRERRTLVVSGRRTTISLEPEIWRSLSDIADRERATLALVADEVDKRRQDASLASGLRVFCLFYWKILAKARMDSYPPLGRDIAATADPTGLMHRALTEMANAVRHRAREAVSQSRGRFGKPV